MYFEVRDGYFSIYNKDAPDAERQYVIKVPYSSLSYGTQFEDYKRYCAFVKDPSTKLRLSNFTVLKWHPTGISCNAKHCNERHILIDDDLTQTLLCVPSTLESSILSWLKYQLIIRYCIQS
jgi:hypothetical protein